MLQTNRSYEFCFCFFGGWGGSFFFFWLKRFWSDNCSKQSITSRCCGHFERHESLILALLFTGQNEVGDRAPTPLAPHVAAEDCPHLHQHMIALTPTTATHTLRGTLTTACLPQTVTCPLACHHLENATHHCLCGTGWCLRIVVPTLPRLIPEIVWCHGTACRPTRNAQPMIAWEQLQREHCLLTPTTERGPLHLLDLPLNIMTGRRHW